VRLEKNEIQPDESVHVYADITNTGSRDGAEVVQMYLRDNVSSVTRRMKELKDFERVYLTKGETATVEFIITPEKLSFYDRNMNFVVEPGDFTVMVGSSSKDEDLQEVKLRVK
jgi:beta-glucosidase